MQTVTFSFGKNWSRFVRIVDEEKIGVALEDIRAHLGGGAGGIEGRDVLDIGSGSGIHSLAFTRLGARRVRSFDFDPFSVSATRTLWEREGRPARWQIEHGSVLDAGYMDSLGTWDIVYSWGVLHHTGEMWKAIENAAARVAPGGRLWLALYMAGPRYEADLGLKRRFNAAPSPVRWMVIGKEVLRQMYGQVLRGRSPLKWNATTGVRGMSTYHDLWDWYGGLPYEVASREEVAAFLAPRGFRELRFDPAGEGACAGYVYEREASR